MKGATERAKKHGYFLCDQACGKNIYVYTDTEGKKHVANADNDEDHKCRTAEIAKLFQYKFNMVPGNILENFMTRVKFAVDQMDSELQHQIKHNRDNAPKFDKWKDDNKKGTKLRHTDLNL